MYEAFMLGKGKYLEKNGLEDRALIIKKHLDRVLDIAERYGFACEIWGDMYMHSAYGGVIRAYQGRRRKGGEARSRKIEALLLGLLSYGRFPL